MIVEFQFITELEHALTIELDISSYNGRDYEFEFKSIHNGTLKQLTQINWLSINDQAELFKQADVIAERKAYSSYVTDMDTAIDLSIAISKESKYFGDT